MSVLCEVVGGPPLVRASPWPGFADSPARAHALRYVAWPPSLLAQSPQRLPRSSLSRPRWARYATRQHRPFPRRALKLLRMVVVPAPRLCRAVALPARWAARRKDAPGWTPAADARKPATLLARTYTTLAQFIATPEAPRTFRAETPKPPRRGM